MQLHAPATVRHAGDADLLTMLRLIGRSPDICEADITPVQRATWDQMLESHDITPYLAELDTKHCFVEQPAGRSPRR